MRTSRKYMPRDLFQCIAEKKYPKGGGPVAMVVVANDSNNDNSRTMPSTSQEVPRASFNLSLHYSKRNKNLNFFLFL